MQLDCVHRSWTLTSGYSEHCLFCRAIDAWLIIKTAFAIALIIRARAIRASCSSANPNVVIGSLYSLQAVALQLLALDPSFSAARFCAAIGLPPALAEPIAEAWSAAGLPP
jgi:hypothetical protein